MWHDMQWHGWGLISIILIIILFVVAVLLVVQVFSRGQTQQVVGEGPGLDILERRYAEGEIDREEFEQKKKDLKT